MSPTLCWASTDEASFKKTVQCHLQPVNHSTSCDKVAIWRTAISLTPCWLYDEKWWCCHLEKCAMSLTVCQSKVEMRLHFWKMCNDTCFLFIMVEGVMRLWFRDRCSLPVWIIEMRLHFWKMCNTTCSLLVMGQNMMRLQLRKITMQLTSCQSLICDSAECAMSLTICWP